MKTQQFLTKTLKMDYLMKFGGVIKVFSDCLSLYQIEYTSDWDEETDIK